MDFLRAIDRARASQSRSQFVRDAAREFVESKGIPVPHEKTIAPDRAGKGGATRYPAHRPSLMVLNDKPSSKTASAVAKLLKKNAASASDVSPKSKH